MRNTIIGLVLAVVLLGGLFYAATHRARHVPVRRAASPAEIQAAAASIKPGFVGARRVGDWAVTCTEKPVVVKRQTPAQPGKATAGADKPAPAPASKPVSLGRCRALLEFRGKPAPHRVMLTMAFRVIGTAPGRLGLFVRIPSGKKGDILTLRVGKAGFRLRIAGCGKGGCMAIGVLSPGTEALFAGLAKGELILPAPAGSTPRGVIVPLAGLPAALAAVRRANS